MLMAFSVDLSGAGLAGNVNCDRSAGAGSLRNGALQIARLRSDQQVSMQPKRTCNLPLLCDFTVP